MYSNRNLNVDASLGNVAYIGFRPKFLGFFHPWTVFALLSWLIVPFLRNTEIFVLIVVFSGISALASYKGVTLRGLSRKLRRRISGGWWIRPKPTERPDW